MNIDDRNVADIVSRVVARLKEKGVVSTHSQAGHVAGADRVGALAREAVAGGAASATTTNTWKRTPLADNDRPIKRKYVLPPVESEPAARQPEANPTKPAPCPLNIVSKSAPGSGIYEDIESACQASARAQAQYAKMGFNARFAVIEALRKAALANLERWSNEAVAETGMGRIEDKIQKNRLVALKTPGPEYLQRPETFAGSDGLASTRLDPFGIVAAVAPCTNSTETIINNGISMLSAGNSVVFNPHPIARRVSADTVRTLNQAIAAAGGPGELLCCIQEPTIDSANLLMRHSLIGLVMVTGGGAVVDSAMKSGKRAICAGPGNPPAVVDESADLERAARSLVAGASLDNNVVCTDEKAILAVAAIADSLKVLLLKHGCVEVTGKDVQRLTELVLFEQGGPGRHGAPNKKLVGKTPAFILRQMGIEVDERVRCILVDVDKDHPLMWTEQLMPVLPLCRLPDAESAIVHAAAVEGGRRHTASIYSQRLDRITRFVNLMNCSICVVNDSNFAGLGLGGEGYTSFSIATPTGEGLTTARTFSRERRLAICAGGLQRF